MSMSKHEAIEFLQDLAKRLRQVPVAYGTDEGDIDTLIDLVSSIKSDFGIEDDRIEDVIRGMNGPKNTFRAILSDHKELLGRVCDYADILADRRRTEPWVIMEEIFRHGSGVSAAIFQLYRKER